MGLAGCCPCPCSGRGSRRLRCCRAVSNCFFNCFFVYCYLFGSWILHRSYFWCWTYDWDTKCGYEPLPVNQSGVKVIVAGHAKTGTWAMTKNLYDIYNNTYHSEEFMTHVWDHIAHDYWLRPENGGQRPRIFHPLLLDHYAQQEERRTGVKPLPDAFIFDQGVALSKNISERFPNDDLRVLQDLSYPKLANYMSRCRIDSVAFDGIDSLFWTVYDVCPNAKVILLDWRSHEAWMRSIKNFAPKWIILTWSTNMLYMSMHALPYGFLVKRLDPLMGYPIDRMLREGRAYLQEDWYVPIQLWCILTFQRTVYSHWWGGLMTPSVPKDEYDEFYKEVARRTAPENLLRWNFKTSTWEELCSFLGVEQCPSSGVMKKHVNNVNAWDKVPFEEVVEPMMLAPLFVLCHWLNWRLYVAALTALFRLFRCLAGLLLRPFRRLRGGAKAD